MIRAKIEWPIGSRRRALVLGFVLAALLAASLMLTAKPAHAEDLTVNNTGDPGDGVCTASGCTLREAITAANAKIGKDTINFNISGGGVKTFSPASALPPITDAVVIDGYSQPGSVPNSRQTGGLDALILVEINGSNAGQNADGLLVQASNVVVKGLAINRLASGDGIKINEAAEGVEIEGNFIGTDASGTLDRGNSFDGVNIEDSSTKNTIGGLTPDKRNLISGNRAAGVILQGKGGNKVQGNLIGTQKDGVSPLANLREGVDIRTPKNTIGGTEPGAANTIAFNFAGGVVVDVASGNRILGNSIFSNDFLGIDLGGNLRTLNDPKDRDAGPNNFQNFPVLTSIKLPEEGNMTIEGTLDSTPSTKKKKKRFTIQFFSSPSGEDEGKTFLGQKRVTTNRQGKASFTFETSPFSGSGNITATATGPGGNTSEFSDPLVIVT